jgi:hypothetical protein
MAQLSPSPDSAVRKRKLRTNHNQQQSKKPIKSTLNKHRIESPPPNSVISERDVLQRGCPGAPKKEAPYSNYSFPMSCRRRQRERNEDNCITHHLSARRRHYPQEDDPESEDDPPRLIQRILPCSVEGITRPTARRLQPWFSPESTMDWATSTTAETTLLGSDPRRMTRLRISLFPSNKKTPFSS